MWWWSWGSKKIDQLIPFLKNRDHRSGTKRRLIIIIFSLIWHVLQEISASSRILENTGFKKSSTWVQQVVVDSCRAKLWSCILSVAVILLLVAAFSSQKKIQWCSSASPILWISNLHHSTSQPPAAAIHPSAAYNVSYHYQNWKRSAYV